VRTLVAGWFSFEQMGASAGDLLARDLVAEWLVEAGREVDVALAAPFDGGVEGGVDWRAVDPEVYAELVFVCGPLGNGEPVAELLERFRGRRRVGVNLTMLHELDDWNPFDVLLERDSSRLARPDLVFLVPARRVPVVGRVLIDAQPEYGERDLHAEVDRAIDELLGARDVAVVPIDTRLDENTTGLRTPAQVESLVARCDVVVTTRLHGLVLALRAGIPAVAIDTVAGGAKVRRQAEALGWPLLAADGLTAAALADTFDWCLTDEAREQARVCAQGAVADLAPVRDAFLAALQA
jgi:Polysaccharide pyruvyl transferase